MRVSKESDLCYEFSFLRGSVEKTLTSFLNVELWKHLDEIVNFRAELASSVWVCCFRIRVYHGDGEINERVDVRLSAIPGANNQDVKAFIDIAMRSAMKALCQRLPFSRSIAAADMRIQFPDRGGGRVPRKVGELGNINFFDPTGKRLRKRIKFWDFSDRISSTAYAALDVQIPDALSGSSGSGVRSRDERASMRIGTHHKI